MGKSNVIRVLQIAGGFRGNVNGKAVSGGVASFLNGYCSTLDSDNYFFCFLSLRNQCFEPYRSTLEAKGWELHCLDLQSDGIWRAVQIIFKLTKFIRNGKYDAVHINMGSFFPVLCCAIAARLGRTKIIIAHSHSSGKYSKKKRVLVNICKPLLELFATDYCACSKAAAENLFSSHVIRKSKYKIIKNAIDCKKFKFNPDVRQIVRTELGLKDELVIGHVGRFVEVKNHSYLLDIFFELKKLIPNAILLLIGDGELKQNIEEKANKIGLYDSVIFTGQRKDVFRFYQAMDVFIMPSILEGFPIVSLEAQCSGVPCYVSDRVTNEVEISDIYHEIVIDSKPEIIAKKIARDLKCGFARKDLSLAIKESGYELKDNVKTFENLYRRGE